MAAQPQPPFQQPVYNELNLALDRLFVRTTGYVETRIEAIAAQLRVYNQESVQRDQDLANLVIAFREESRKHLEALREETKLHIEALRTEVGALRTEVRDNHAEAMEGINKLRQAILELRQKDTE